ncbi:unnamed protein product, partial [marine sediment metagenome]
PIVIHPMVTLLSRVGRFVQKYVTILIAATDQKTDQIVIQSCAGLAGPSAASDLATGVIEMYAQKLTCYARDFGEHVFT